MKKIISFLIVLFVVVDITAQTQQGYVRTITRFNRPSIGLDSVLLKFKDRPRVKSHSKGKFSIDLPGYKEGQGYVLENVVKAGYELKNIGDLKEYGYSTSVPLTIDMYSVKDKNEDQKAIYNKIYHDLSNNFQKRYEQLLDELDATQSDKVSIQKELADLQKIFDNTKSLLEKIASRYATINIEQMTSFERELQMCIEQGNMSTAVELINSEGGIDAIVKDAEQSQKEASLAKRIIETSNMKVEKAINSLYALYVGSLANLDYKSATSYIYKIANLDTCNFANQIEASLYLGLTGNYDDAFKLANRAYGIGNANNNSEQKAEAFDNLGDIYLITKDYNNALKYYGNAIKKMIKEGVKYIELDNYDNETIDAVEVDDEKQTNVAIGAFTVNEDWESQTDNIGIGVFYEETHEALTYKDSLLLSSLYTKMAMLNTINGNINKANLYMGRYLSYKPTDSYNNSDYWESYIIQTVTIGTTMVALGQWKLAETLFNQLLVLIQSVKSNDSSWAMLSSIVNARLAQVCANIVDKRHSAIKYAEESLKDLNRVEESFINYEMRTAVYIATAIAYQANNDYDKSFELIDSAKVAYRHSYRQDTLTYCTLLNNTGQLYYKLDKWDEAIACFQEALNTGYDSNNAKSPLRSMLLYNIGQNLREKHMLDSALVYHKKALEIRERMADNSAIGIYTLSESYSGMAWIYYTKNENIKAAELYEKAYEIRREIFGPNNIEVCKMKKNAYYSLYYGASNNNNEEIKEYFNNYMANNAFALVNKDDSLVATPYYLLSVDKWNVENTEDAFSSYNNCKNTSSIFVTEDKKTISAADLPLDNYIVELVPVDENEKKQIVRLYNKNRKKIKKILDGRSK